MVSVDFTNQIKNMSKFKMKEILFMAFTILTTCLVVQQTCMQLITSIPIKIVKQ